MAVVAQRKAIGDKIIRTDKKNYSFCRSPPASHPKNRHKSEIFLEKIPNMHYISAR